MLVGLGLGEGIVGTVLTAVVIVMDHGVVPVDDGRDMDAAVDVDDGAILLGVQDHPTARVVDVVAMQAVGIPEGIVTVRIVQLAGSILPLLGGDAVADDLAGDVEKGADQQAVSFQKCRLV